MKQYILKLICKTEQNGNLILTVKFMFVGLAGFIINYSTLSILLNTATNNKLLASMLATALAVNTTFLLHDKWTYQPRKRHVNSYFKRYLSFMASNFISAVLTVGFFISISHYIKSNLFALSIAATVGMVWNFCINKYVIWREHKAITVSKVQLSSESVIDLEYTTQA